MTQRFTHEGYTVIPTASGYAVVHELLDEGDDDWDEEKVQAAIAMMKQAMI